MDFSTEAILKRMKAELKNEDSHIEGSFTMDNLQAVSEELGRFHAMNIVPLKEAIADRKDNVSTSGNERHYIQWAKEVENEAGEKVVGNARAYGVRDGSGIVYVALISNSAEAPSPEIVQLVTDYIQARRPVGAKPIITAAEAVEIEIGGIIEVKQGFDIASIKSQAVTAIKKYFTEIAFMNSKVVLNYYRLGILISEIPGVKEVIDYSVNRNKDSIEAEYNQYFSLKGLILNGN